MNRQPLKVLFLCTGNAARSIMAEVILNASGGERFAAHSAGSHPSGEINPAALAQLLACGHETDGLRSKSWDEFALPDAPAFDYVITVCNNVANETCPVWIGRPLSAHWGIPDPAAVAGSDEEIRQAFEVAYRRLANRIDAFVSMPLESMAAGTIEDALREIGRSRD